MANAGGRLVRAEALRHMREAAPGLVAALAGQREAGYVSMWQRGSTQSGGWPTQRSERGAWQGAASPLAAPVTSDACAADSLDAELAFASFSPRQDRLATLTGGP